MERVAIFGKQGMGKSYYMKNIVKQSLVPVIIIDVLDEYAELAELLPCDTLPENYYFKTRMIPKNEEDVNKIIRGISFKKPNNTLLIYDEVDMYSTSSAYMADDLLNLMKFARHYHIEFYFSVRNPIEMNRKLSALCNKFIIFNLTEPRYLDYFSRYNLELPERIAALPPHKHIEFIL